MLRSGSEEGITSQAGSYKTTADTSTQNNQFKYEKAMDLGAVHILRKHILGSLNTLGGVVSVW